jgi:putative sterol carrier protein
MPVDIAKLFNEYLPERLAKHSDEAKAIGATYQMNITGSGSWFIDVSPTGPACVAGEKPADCTITISSDDFQKLYDEPQSQGMQLFFTGKLKLSGNQMLAMKLQKLFTLK